MADAPPTADELAKMLERLPRDQDQDEKSISLRLRLTTQEGRIIFAFVRAGEGTMSFAGWEVRSGMTGEEAWEYFVVGAEKLGAPIQVMNRNGPLGTVVAAELEDRGQ
jgi:hypothetical protein